MSDYQKPKSFALMGNTHCRSPSKSPKKKASFNSSAKRDATAQSGILGDMKTTPNARNSVSRFVNEPTRIMATEELKLSAKNEEDMTPSDRRQLNVLREIGSLQCLTPEGKAPVRTSGNTDLRSQNLETLLRAARYTPEARGVAIVPAESTSVKTSTATPSKTGKKRARPDDDDEYRENTTPNPKRPVTRSTTAAAAKPVVRNLPKLPMNHISQIKPKVDLAQLAPQPLRISYKAHPLEDRTDAWYIEMFRRLFRQTHRFVSHYFGVHDINAGDFFEPWAANMTPEFVAWVEQVAKPDPNLGTWDDLLRDTQQRKWLVMAILMKILRVKVFDADLFGANQEQAELLHGISRALVGREGFSRNALRAETVRTIIGRNAVTENFYLSVGTLTAQISLLFKPLTDYLYSMPPSLGAPLPKITDQYQALHNLVSTAAYLSLCIRLSPTIFSINDVSPGTPWDDTDHHSLADNLYMESKDAVLANFTAKLAAWERRRAELDAEVKALETAGKTETRAGHSANTLLTAHLAAEPKLSGWDYRPMAKIGVWPVITRYKPGGDGDDEKGGCNKHLREKDGFRSSQIGKGAVVAYYGRDGKDADGMLSPNPSGEKKRLRCWIGNKEQTGGEGMSETGKVVAGLGAAVVGVMMVGGYGMLNDSFPMLQGMDYVEAARFLACEVLRMCNGAS